MTDESEMMDNYNRAFSEDFEQVDAVNEVMAEENEEQDEPVENTDRLGTDTGTVAENETVEQAEVKQPWEDLPSDCIYYEKMYDDGHLGSFTESPEMAYRFGWTENRIGKDEVQQSDKNGWTYVKDKCPMQTDSDIRIAEARLEITRLKRLLSDSDYKAIKFAEGEISAEDYESTKTQRKAWRAEINALEDEIIGLGD